MEKCFDEQIKLDYGKKSELIKQKLSEFRNLPRENYKNELLFCLLTPQSNAQKCWQAVEEISKLPSLNQKNVSPILSTKTRFHNRKTDYIINALSYWNEIEKRLGSGVDDIHELRNWLAENIKGMGLKEASHFLRNIGKSNNQIAILDRHILRNLHSHGLIKEPKIKNQKHYLEIEQIFLDYSRKINIPPDELDLLWWSKENGEIFK